MTWERVNLALLEGRPPLTPSLGGLGLIYPGKRHVFSGPPESAKTIAAYFVALAVIRDGGLVVLVDLEMGTYDARDRLRDLGATDDDLGRLVYVAPEESATAEIIAGLLALGPSLVMVDASAGAYQLQGLDDNQRKDVETFARLWLRPFWQQGVATIVVDHVVKNTENRGRFAIGSERKSGGADVHLGFEPIHQLSRGGHGLVRIVTHKDRFGYLPRPKAAELDLVSDPATNAITCTLRPAKHDGASEADQWKPTGLMERISGYLETRGEVSPSCDIETAVKGKHDYKRQALATLVADGYVEETKGAHNARCYVSIKP
jgi:AAA domain